MSGPLPHIGSSAVSADGVYQVANSVSLPGSKYLARTQVTPTDADGWALSVHVKRSLAAGKQYIAHAGAGSDTNYAGLYFLSNNRIEFAEYTGAFTWRLQTWDTFAELDRWYHIVAVYEGNNPVTTDRIRLYIDGVRINTFNTTPVYPALGAASLYINVNGVALRWGSTAASLFYYLNSYLAQAFLHDGGGDSDATTYGVNDSGVWRPIDITGISRGANGSLLAFTNSSDLGEDEGAGTNDHTATGFTAFNQTTDTPTQNSSLFDPTNPNFAATLSENNVVALNAQATYEHTYSTLLIPKNSGKFYFELKLGSVLFYHYTGLYPASDLGLGQATPAQQTDQFVVMVNAIGRYDVRMGGVTSTPVSWPAPALDGVMCCAYDSASGDIWFGINGDFRTPTNVVGDPAAGTNPTYNYSGAEDMSPMIAAYQVTAGTQSPVMNWGQRAFSHQPAGFNPVNEKHLP